MKKLILQFTIMLMLPMVASADIVEIDGIYYNLIPKGNAVEVASNPQKYKGVINTPESVTYEGNSYKVTHIMERAFFLCSSLVSITIPNGITIGDGAFNGCTSLLSVTIPKSVTSIGKGVFGGCSSLTTITIPNSVTSIGDGAFNGCSGLTSLTIPNGVTSIGDYAFSGCSGLTSFTIPNSVVSIGLNAFESCSGLSSVHISNLESWCKISFSGGYSNPLSVAHHLYLNGEEIINLVIPNGITSIGNDAFDGCTFLTSVTIPNTVTNIGNGAFSGCSGLPSITIPNSVTKIGPNAFRSCSGLQSVTIPNSVTSIGKYAFYECSSPITITIGSGIKSIQGYAFASCTKITDVNCYSESVPETNTEAFKDSYINYVTLHVPSSAVNTYKSATPWKDFGNIVALTDSDPKPTGIKMIHGAESKGHDYFDLNGRKLTDEPMQKGIYISNGQKVIVK